ncbi:RNA polymerase III subunit C82 [Lunasporangiospora selenospora]|uniref:DNA-directed RNA polymerase III subunit RPC3 n=1 Tax=Lunasporangiospora selenospora TaxID=979761 RepID=A0A9P6G189_9FUNG|nr:RNA polymerase III subunit C82 [Lunasporangiospora selenospora]
MEFANVLIRKGRMSVPLIIKFTELKPRQVRESLLVLIQHNIAYYAESEERSRIVTYYEIDKEETLHRVLIPKVLQYSKLWFDREGEEVALSILTHGKQRITDLIGDAPVKSAQPGSRLNRAQLTKKMFTKMVKEKCLIAVRPSDSLAPVDRAMAEEKKETDKLTLPPTAAELANIRRTLGAQKGQEQSRTTIVGLKRTLDTVDGADGFDDGKRRKLTDGDLQIIEEVERDVFFKINFDRFIIRWRNMKIAGLYETRLNPTARKIMDSILSIAEERMINCKEDMSSSVNIMLLFNNLPTDVNLVDTLEFDPIDMGPNNTKPKPSECLEKYLQILEDDLLRILKKDAGRSGQYTIQLKAANKILKKNLIQDIVATRYGLPYVRIMNMLLDKGKLEEKQISKFSMMPVKDVREKLTTLCTFGVLNLQEVPKTNDRTPSRTFYLWEVVLPRAADSLSDNLYHAMGNLRQRRFVERARRSVLLEKCERTDVKANDALLNAAEKAELNKLNGVLEQLEIQELRLAEMVMTLRDF